MVETATFAGGCFWCMQPIFDALPGVLSTEVGYSGGFSSHPTYEAVCSGNTGHAESIQITFDPQRVSYERLLNIFWRNIDPFAQNRQFTDKGTQYRTIIFYHSPAQEKAALNSRKEISQLTNLQVYTEILPAVSFYTAESEHQKYYQKKPNDYKFYHLGSGRDKRLEEIWGKS